jgi:predicted RNA-binding protein YlxR (DUF448 family)
VNIAGNSQGRGTTESRQMGHLLTHRGFYLCFDIRSIYLAFNLFALERFFPKVRVQCGRDHSLVKGVEVALF